MQQEDTTVNREDQGDEFEANADDEYQVWKKNAPLLYDTLVSHLLEWPSLTCQFIPGIEDIPDTGFCAQKLIIGTNTAEGDQNYLMLMKSRLPGPRGAENGLRPGFNCIELDTKIAHPGEINKARCAYRAHNWVATKAENANVYVFDVSQHPPTPSSSDYCPQIVLTGHTSQGFALDWKYSGEMHLISGDNEGGICFWDLEKQLPESGQGGKEYRLAPTRKFENNGKAVNEVKFHRVNSPIFACASEDSTLSFWDLRNKNDPFIKLVAHPTEVFALDFAYSDEFLLLSGAADGLIKLWDMRKLTRTIHEFQSHTDKVLRVEWNPNNETLFASSGEDKTVNIWDCSRIGDDVDTEDHPDGPPELLFKHRGHKGRVDDICWNPEKELALMSTDSANLLQIWEIDDGIYFDDLSTIK